MRKALGTALEGALHTAAVGTRQKGQRDTEQALLRAAGEEFARHGFAGTDSNKIARAAGFAPQTFYRWFSDKTAIFVAVYRAWEEAERALLMELIAQRAGARKLADAIVAHHRDHLQFRRSLRQLSVQDPVVRRARAESRQRQIERIRQNFAVGRPNGAAAVHKPGEVAVVLLQIERLADAIAEGEFRDLGMDDRAARAALAKLIQGLQSENRA